MSSAISNTSPLLYLYRIGKIELLPRLFDEAFTVPAVVDELRQGKAKGYDVPVAEQYGWLQVVSPKRVPSEWLASDLGRGELETMALALEHREKVVILDDVLAVLLESKKRKMIPQMASVVDDLKQSGMWISDDIRRRILRLAERPCGRLYFCSCLSLA